VLKGAQSFQVLLLSSVDLAVHHHAAVVEGMATQVCGFCVGNKLKEGNEARAKKFT
jgi:hypothetical protein